MADRCAGSCQRFGVARQHGLHATVVGLQQLLLVMPLGQQYALAQRHVVRRGRGQIEIELQTRGGGLAVLRHAQTIQVFRRPVVGRLVLFGGAIDLDVFGPAEDALGAERHHEAVLVFRHVDALGLIAAVFLVLDVVAAFVALRVFAVGSGSLADRRVRDAATGTPAAADDWPAASAPRCRDAAVQRGWLLPVRARPAASARDGDAWPARLPPGGDSARSDRENAPAHPAWRAGCAVSSGSVGFAAGGRQCDQPEVQIAVQVAAAERDRCLRAGSASPRPAR